MNENILNVKFINELLAIKDSFKNGEKVNFTYKNDNEDIWKLTLKKESEQYSPFIFALEGKKIGTNVTWNRRYTSLEQLILHIVNCFNENVNIKDNYSTLDEYIINAKIKEKRNIKETDYMMLDRLRTDCEYFLGNGNGFLGSLYYKDIDKQIEEMKKLYESFSEQEKPKWISLKNIEDYKEKMEEKLKDIEFKKQDYKYIIQCDLDSDENKFMNQYLLVEDVNTPSELDVDLIGDCCFNCNYKILNKKIVAKVYSLEDVKEFCRSNKIEIEKNLDIDGNLIIGASKDMIIAKDMNRYDKEIELNLSNEEIGENNDY